MGQFLMMFLKEIKYQRNENDLDCIFLSISECKFF